MSRFVPPGVHVCEVGHSLRIRRMGGLQVKQKPKAVEIPFDVIVAWVALF